MSCRSQRCQLGLHPFSPLPNPQLLVLGVATPWRFEVCCSCQASCMPSPDNGAIRGRAAPQCQSLHLPAQAAYQQPHSCLQRFALNLPSQANWRKPRCHLNTWGLLPLLLEVRTKCQGRAWGPAHCHSASPPRAGEFPALCYNSTTSGRSQLLTTQQTSRCVPLPPRQQDWTHTVPFTIHTSDLYFIFGSPGTIKNCSHQCYLSI